MPAATKKPPTVQTDYMIVDAPLIFPSRCVTCNGTKGPLIDTRRDTQIGRVYVCSNCVTLCARVLGLIEGERHTELLNAGEKIGQLEQDVSLRDAQLQEQLARITDLKTRFEASQELLNFEKGNAEAMRHMFSMIEEQARQGRTTAS